MPQALALAIITAVGATGIAAALITAVVTIGFTIGVSLLTNALFGPSRPKPSDGQQNVKVAIGSRRRHYGIVHTGGQDTFLESSAGTLGIVVTLGTGLESEILEHRINDKVVTLTGNTVTEANYHGAIHIYTRPGDPDQSAIGELTAKFPAWTADHRQRGCAHAAIICDPVKQELFSEVFNGQRPQYTQVRKAATVYDPRKDSTAVIGLDDSGDPVMGDGAHRLDDESSWEWSDNGVLVPADYFAHPDGYGGGYDAVNWTNIAQEADIADEQVLTVTDEMIARWRIWASYSLASDKRADVLSDMLKAIDGFCWQDAEGKFNLMCGRFEEPDITISDDHILSLTATLGPDASQQVSAIKMLYTEASIGYREQESATIVNPDAGDDPNTDPQAVQAYYIPANNQAARVGKIIVRQLGDRWHINAVLNLYGLNLLGRRFIALSSAQFGVTGYFKIDGLKLNLAVCTVEATLAEVKPEDWDFDAATEEGTPPDAPDATDYDYTIPAPTDLVPDVAEDAGGFIATVIWSAGPVGFSYRGQWRVAGGTWNDATVDQDAPSFMFPVTASDSDYDYRVRAVSIGGRLSDWATGSFTTGSVGIIYDGGGA